MFRTFLASALLLLSACAPAEESGPVVLGAASMTEAIEAAADAWEAQGHLRPVLSFAGSAAVARQVEQGAPADVVITADAQWMDWLADADLISATSRRDIASNSLVFVWNGTSPALPTQDDWQPIRIALADPDSIPAGRYARSALEHAGVWDRVAEVIVPTENVRQALALVERGEVQLGVVYSSDARTVPALGTAALPLPEHVEVLYPAAQVAGSSHPDVERFLDFLSSPDGAAIFCQHGFTMPQGRAPC